MTDKACEGKALWYPGLDVSIRNLTFGPRARP